MFNPTDEVAEVEVEVRLDDPATNGVPEPFEATVAPHRYAIVDLHEPDLEETAGHPEADPRRREAQHHRALPQRGAGRGREGAHPVRAAGQRRRRRDLGAPLAAPRWLLVAGGVSEERAERVTLFNPSTDAVARFSVDALDDGAPW